MTRGLVGLAAAVLLAVSGEASAASLTLSDADKQAAMQAGARSVTVEDFDREWRVSNDGGEVTVLTPFHRLAVAARHAAFRNESLKPVDIDRTVKKDAGRLVVWVHLRGRSEDFARYYVPRLMLGDREIKAAFVQNERTALRQEDGRYLARCAYGFPLRDLDGRARFALIVADIEGRDISQFTIDLSVMR